MDTDLTAPTKPGYLRRVLRIAFGIVAPLGCLSIETLTHMCRQALFDPIPTVWHVLLILTVPAATWLGMRALEQPERRTRALGMLLGCASCVSLMYAVPFVPLLPFSLLMIFAWGFGLLGLAPILAPITLFLLAAEFILRARDAGGRKLPGIWTGFCSCVLLLALIDVGPVRTILKVRELWASPNDTSIVEWLRAHGDRQTLEELGSGRLSARPLAHLVRNRVEFDADFVRNNWRLFTGEDLPESLKQIARD